MVPEGGLALQGFSRAEPFSRNTRISVVSIYTLKKDDEDNLGPLDHCSTTKSQTRLPICGFSAPSAENQPRGTVTPALVGLFAFDRAAQGPLWRPSMSGRGALRETGIAFALKLDMQYVSRSFFRAAYSPKKVCEYSLLTRLCARNHYWTIDRSPVSYVCRDAMHFQTGFRVL